MYSTTSINPATVTMPASAPTTPALTPEVTGFKVKRPVWQQEGLGFTVDREIYEPIEALLLASANWGVYKSPLGSNLSNVETDIPYYFQDTGLYGVYRDFDNQFLGAIGNSFKLVQNVDGFEWFRPFLDGKHAYIESAGTLRHGEIVWVIARLTANSCLDVIPGDAVEQRLLLTLCHNTRRSPQATFINTRATCQNVLGQANHRSRSNATLMKMRQTKSIAGQMTKVAEKIDLARRHFTGDVEAYRQLARTRLSYSQMRGLLMQLFESPLSQQKEKDGRLELMYPTLESYKPARLILEALDKLDTLQSPYVTGTGWALYNAIAHYETYLAKDTRRGSQLTKLEAQLEALWFVSKTNVLNSALDLILNN